MFKVRQDFIAAEKVQMEDDISASVVVPADMLPNLSPKSSDPSRQAGRQLRVAACSSAPMTRSIAASTTRPKQDMAQRDNFLANFEPLKGDTLTEIVDDVVGFGQYTEPMRNILQERP